MITPKVSCRLSSSATCALFKSVRKSARMFWTSAVASPICISILRRFDDTDRMRSASAVGVSFSFDSETCGMVCSMIIV